VIRAYLYQVPVKVELVALAWFTSLKEKQITEILFWIEKDNNQTFLFVSPDPNLLF
jgi:hypothetical protein